MASKRDNFDARMKALGERIERNIAGLQGHVMDAIQEHVIIGTPVKTGEARNGWRVGDGAPDTTLETQGPFDKSGQTRIDANRAVCEAHDTPTPLYLDNQVHYIPDLNQGSSQQAPAGFVQAATVVAISAIKGARIVT